MAETKTVEKVYKIQLSRGEKHDLHVDPERIEDMIVLDEEETAVRFGDIYKFKRSVVIFMRHPQCFTAKEYMDDLCKISDDALEAADVQLVTIGPHSPRLLSIFRNETGFRHKMFADPEKVLYKELGFNLDMSDGRNSSFNSCKHVKSGWLSGVLSSTIRTMTYKDYMADMKQNGGSLICGPGRIISFSRADKNMFDACPINNLLQELDIPCISFPKDPRVLVV